jgi:hypothetical protein
MQLVLTAARYFAILYLVGYYVPPLAVFKSDPIQPQERSFEAILGARKFNKSSNFQTSASDKNVTLPFSMTSKLQEFDGGVALIALQTSEPNPYPPGHIL